MESKQSVVLRRKEDPRKVCLVGNPHFSDLSKRDEKAVLTLLLAIINQHFKSTSKKV